MGTKDYAEVFLGGGGGGANKVCYGECGNGEFMYLGNLANKYQTIEHSNSAQSLEREKEYGKKIQADMNLISKTHHSPKLMMRELRLNKVTRFLKTFGSKLRRETRMTSLRLPF